MMVAYQDWKSGGFVGFEIMLEENTQCITSALRNSIINLGKVPKFVYLDNGKAFKTKYFVENGLSGLFRISGFSLYMQCRIMQRLNLLKGYLENYRTVVKYCFLHIQERVLSKSRHS